MSNNANGRPNRRQLLSGLGAAGVAGLAGCSGLVGSDEESPDETPDGTPTGEDTPADGTPDDADSENTDGNPGSVVESYIETLILEETLFSDLAHSAVVEEDIEIDGFETTVVEDALSREYLVEHSDIDEADAEVMLDGDTAVVEANGRVRSNGETQEELTLYWIVATEDGEWRVVGEDHERGENGGNDTVTPAVAFTFEYSRDQQQVTIVHDSGDTVPARNLYIRGEGIADGYRGSWDEIEGSGYGPEDSVAAGNRLTVDVTGDDFELRVVWESGDHSATLAEYDGPEA
jgi:hypothetical protein